MSFEEKGCGLPFWFTSEKAGLSCNYEDDYYQVTLFHGDCSKVDGSFLVLLPDHYKQVYIVFKKDLRDLFHCLDSWDLVSHTLQWNSDAEQCEEDGPDSHTFPREERHYFKMESPKLSKDLEVLIENQASLLYSPTLDFHPKHRNLQVLTFDPSLTKEMCVTKFFRVLDQYYEFHSFGSSSKCILQHNLSDALSDAENKTMNFVNTVLLRFDDVPTSTWNHMHASVINICERIRAVVTHKNKRNFGLYAYRIKNKVEAEFKQSLKDQLYFLFVDEPHTFLTQYYGKNGRDLYLKKFYYHSDVVKITKDTVYLAFIKSNQYASKLNPQKEPDVESSMGFKRYEEDIYIHGDKTVRENRRIIGDFREFVATNRAELEEYLEKNQNQLKQPEVKKGIAERLETSISQVKHVCEVFAVNNSERLKKLYIKHLNNAVKFALHNADLGNEDDYVVMDVEKEEAIEISLLFHQPGVTIINDFETGLSPAVAVENFRRSKFPCLSSNAGASSEQGEDNEEAKKARFE